MTQFPTHDLIYLSFTSRIGLRVAEYGSLSFLELSCIHFTSNIYIRTFPYPQSWQTQQISGRKFGKNEEIFGIWEEISWLATDNCSPQRAVQSLGIERKFFLSKWLKIRTIFNFNLSNVLNPKYYWVSNQLLWTFCIDILLVYHIIQLKIFRMLRPLPP